MHWSQGGFTRLLHSGQADNLMDEIPTVSSANREWGLHGSMDGDQSLERPQNWDTVGGWAVEGGA